MRITSLLVAAGLLLTSGCDVLSSESDPPEGLLSVHWVLARTVGTDRVEAGSGRIAFHQSSELSGSFYCNGGLGNYTIRSQKMISLQGGSITRAYCDGRDSDAWREIARVRRMHLEQDSLRLYGPGFELVFSRGAQVD